MIFISSKGPLSRQDSVHICMMVLYRESERRWHSTESDTEATLGADLRMMMHDFFTFYSTFDFERYELCVDRSRDDILLIKSMDGNEVKPLAKDGTTLTTDFASAKQYSEHKFDGYKSLFRDAAQTMDESLGNGWFCTLVKKQHLKRLWKLRFEELDALVAPLVEDSADLDESVRVEPVLATLRDVRRFVCGADDPDTRSTDKKLQNLRSRISASAEQPAEGGSLSNTAAGTTMAVAASNLSAVNSLFVHGFRSQSPSSLAE